MNDLLQAIRDDDTAIRAFPPRMRHVVADEGMRGRVVALCAEPGMGKLSLALRAMDLWARRGAWTRHCSLAGRSSAGAADELATLLDAVRGHSHDERHPVIVISNVPAPDECDVDRQAEAILGMSELGCLVVLCLLPEAEQLVEELPYAICLRTGDLLREGLASADTDSWQLAHGIPALVDCCERNRRSDVVRAVSGLVMGSDYRHELSELAGLCLRTALPDDERRVRLAMLLLGSGTFDEVAAITDRLDEDTLEWLEQDAPLFGVNRLAGTFSCAGLCLYEGLRGCVNALRPSCEQMAEVVARSTRVLASRGDVRRAALACELCGRDDLAVLGREWGVELVCAGEDALVARALEVGVPTGGASLAALEKMASTALSALVDSVAGMRHRPLPPMESPEGSPWLRVHRRHAELLQACRDLDRGVEPGRVAMPRDGDDDTSRALVAHLQARSLLLHGRFSEAHALLVDNTLRQRPTTMLAALLSDDYEIARMMMGEEPTSEDREAFCAARTVFQAMRSSRLRRYHEALEQVLAVAAARAERADLAETIAYAEKMGDHAVRAVLLVAAAVADVRSRSYARAHVHARLVMDMAGDVASDYLLDVTRLLDALVWSHLEDRTTLRELATSSRPSLAGDLALLATSRRWPDGGAPRLRVLSRVRNPKDELWLLNLLLNDFEGDGISQAFRGNVPKTWAALSRGAVRKAEQFLRMVERVPRPVPGALERRATPSERPREKHQAPRINVRILGGVEVLFDGEPITQRLGRRMAKPYLLLLAASRRHELGVYEIIESLWPGADLSCGRQRIYNANSELRRVFNSRENGISPIDVGRGEGMIRLDASVVHVDADDFVRAVDGALAAAGDDVQTVRLATDALMLYGGDVAMTQHDARGLVAARRSELRGMYADVAVAGAMAALREGRLLQAVQMAQGAYGVNDMREDVVVALIEALKAVGRGGEACAVYDSYARQLQHDESRPPSPVIRRLIEDVYRSAHGTRGVTMTSQREEQLLLV